MQLSPGTADLNQFTLLKAPTATTIALKGTLKAASSLQFACSKLQTHFSGVPDQNPETESAKVRLDLTTTYSLIASLRKSLSLDEQPALDKVKKTFSLLNFSLIEKVESAFIQASESSSAYTNRNLQEAKKSLALAQTELDQVQELLLSLEKLRAINSKNFLKLASYDGAILNLAQEELRQKYTLPLCSSERLLQYLKRNCPKAPLSSDFIHFTNTYIGVPDFVETLSNRFANRELSKNDFDNIMTIFRFFNHEQRVGIGRYLCNLISPTYQTETKTYLRKLEQLSATLCNLTKTANLSAQLLELISGHSLTVPGRSLRSVVANQLFSIQPNGAVLIQRIYDASNPKSDSVSAVTSLGILPLINGEVKEDKWNLFHKTYKLKQINVNAVPLNGGVVAHYQVGLDNNGVILPDVVISPLKSSIPHYLAVFIFEAVKPFKRASA